MSLDLEVRKRTYEPNNFDKWSVEVIDNFRNCYEIMEHIQRLYPMDNGTTVCLDSNELKDILTDMKDDLQIIKDRKICYRPAEWTDDDFENYCSKRERILSKEIDTLECFVNDNVLSSQDDLYFDVHAWW